MASNAPLHTLVNHISDCPLIATLRKIRCYLLITTLSIAILTIGYLTPTKWNFGSDQTCDFNIYVKDGGIHTDIIVPVKTPLFDWQNYLSIDRIGSEATQNYNYLSFGWGDKDFFINTRTWRDFKLFTAFKALFFPRNLSIIHVQGYKYLPRSKNNEIKCVRLNKKDYLKLMEFINYSFEQKGGNKIRVANGYYSYDGFYAAKGSYSIFRTCNSWTAEGLKLANINTPLWAGTSSSVMLQLRSDCDCV